MHSFVTEMAGIERAANTVAKACQPISVAARSVARAASDGDLIALRKAFESLAGSASTLARLISDTTGGWSLSVSEEEALLLAEYERALADQATSEGFKVFKNDRDLIVYPFVVRLTLKDRVLSIDGKKTTAIRPDKVVATLKEKRARLKPAANERFLETLYSAYKVIAGRDRTGQAVLIRELYDVLTLLPGSASAYSESEFVRDIYLVDREGPRTTKSGAQLTLPASTGTKSRHGVVSFVGPEGERVDYYAIQFKERQHGLIDQL